MSVKKEQWLTYVKGISLPYLIALYLVLVLALGMLLSSLLLYPQEQRIRDIEVQLQMERQKLTTVEGFVLSHANPEQYLADMQKTQLKTELLLPNLLGIAKFVGQLEAAARTSGVKLAYVKPAATAAEKTGYREMPVELSVEGSFYGIMSFAKKLEDGERFCLPTAFLIQPKQNLLSAKINLQIFAYGNSPKPAPPAQAPGNPAAPQVR